MILIILETIISRSYELPTNEYLCRNTLYKLWIHYELTTYFYFIKVSFSYSVGYTGTIKCGLFSFDSFDRDWVLYK